MQAALLFVGEFGEEEGIVGAFGGTGGLPACYEVVDVCHANLGNVRRYFFVSSRTPIRDPSVRLLLLIYRLCPPFGLTQKEQEELETENKRLRAELHHQREENQLLAELLTGQFEEEDGEIDDPVEEGEGFTEKRSRFVISEAAIDLFEALPEAFTLDEALDAAEGLGVTSSKAALYLHAYIQEDMVVQEGSRFTKTGRKPYF